MGGPGEVPHLHRGVIYARQDLPERSTQADEIVEQTFAGLNPHDRVIRKSPDIAGCAYVSSLPLP